MKVKLIQMTENPIDVMWVAARTCYSEKSPIEMWEEYWEKEGQGQEDLKEKLDRREKHWKLVKTVLSSGHQSVAEHVYFTFAIEGISRACSHQLVRHRAGIVFSQQSQRYVKLQDGNFDFVYPDNVAKNNEIVKKFDNVIESISQCYDEMMVTYGIKAEDARSLLPNATKTNITMSINYRELIHICNLRLCTRAQKEIRDLFGLIVKEVKAQDPRLAELLVPSCEVNGICFEHNSCGRKPTKKEVINIYNMTQDEFVSEEDFLDMIESAKNPKVNKNLKKFLEMVSVLEE